MLNIYNNILVFCKGLGYEITEGGDIDIDVVLQYSLYVTIVAKKGDKTIYLLVSDISSDGIKKVELMKRLPRVTTNVRVIIVTNTLIKQSTLKSIQDVVVCENVPHVRFKVDPRRMIFVPVHEICSKEKITTVMKEEGVLSLHNFPSILLTDPQVFWIGGVVGDLIRITRKEKGGITLAYRHVI
jgi:DNA-directed RNA polymerase subunit H (RpoH/RPB5)